MLSLTINTFRDILANHFFPDKADKASRIQYGANESYWNKYGLKELKSPGVITTITEMNFPAGMSGRLVSFMGDTNSGQTITSKYCLIRTNLVFSLAFCSQDIDQQMDLIHKYVELATKASYMLEVEDGSGDTFEYPLGITNFQDLVIPPAGRQSSSYDNQGLIYNLEGSVTLETALYMRQDKKIIRSVRPKMEYTVIEEESETLADNFVDNIGASHENRIR